MWWTQGRGRQGAADKCLEGWPPIVCRPYGFSPFPAFQRRTRAHIGAQWVPPVALLVPPRSGPTHRATHRCVEVSTESGSESLSESLHRRTASTQRAHSPCHPRRGTARAVGFTQRAASGLGLRVGGTGGPIFCGSAISRRIVSTGYSQYRV